MEQPGGMISEESQAQGYALMCVAYPTEDCSARVIPEVSMQRRCCGHLPLSWNRTTHARTQRPP